jgi:hypothetical protein
MDVLAAELVKLQGYASLSAAVDDVDQVLEQLQAARDTIAASKIHFHCPSL